MERYEKKHILFLGLDHRLLWQLTRTLAHLEDRIVIDCVKDPGAAKEICDREVVHVIVVDGWEQAWQAAHHLAGEETFEGGSWKWVVLADSLPLECLPEGRLSPSAVLLEKPFNPKEFPSFLLRVVESREVPAEEAFEPVSKEISLPLVAGESYREPEVSKAAEEKAEEPVGVDVEPVERVVEPAEPLEPVVPAERSEPVESAEFYQHVDQGFVCLSEKDWKGAKEHWREALRIRPNDERLKTNLRRLEKMIGEQN